MNEKRKKIKPRNIGDEVTLREKNNWESTIEKESQVLGQVLVKVLVQMLWRHFRRRAIYC
jgi:hypothetical protein